MTIKHWKVASAQTVGRGHLKQKLPCQDYTYIKQTPEMNILILADGAGSAAFSHIGANAVVHKMANVLQEHFEDMFKEEDHQLLRKRIIGILLQELESIENYSGSIKNYASTLLYVAIKGDRYLAGHIGDGVIGTQLDGGNFKVLSNPENGMYANTTYFVTSEEAWKYLRHYKGGTDGKIGFILMSDGTAESLFNKQAQGFAPAITRMLEWLQNYPNQKISDVLKKNLDEVIKQQTQDDCSIAIASLVTLNAEELINASPEYLTDFIGVHSKLAKDGTETIEVLHNEKTALTEYFQQTEIEHEKVSRNEDDKNRENINVQYEPGEQPDGKGSLESFVEKSDGSVEVDHFSEATVENISLDKDLKSTLSVNNSFEVKVENQKLEIISEEEE